MPQDSQSKLSSKSKAGGEAWGVRAESCDSQYLT